MDSWSTSSCFLPPTVLYNPRLPSWGSHLGFVFCYVKLFSKIKIEYTYLLNESSRNRGLTKSKLSADV